MLRNLCLIASIMFFVNLGFVYAEPFTYHWEIDETPAGSEEVSVIKPIVVEMLDGTLKISNSIVKCYRLFRPQFSKVKTSFFPDIREVSNTLTPNAGVSDYTPV